MDRRDELHRLDRDRGDRAFGAARGDDTGRDVHLAQYPPAEDMAVGVDVAGAGHHPQDGRALEVGHSLSLSSWTLCAAASSWPLELLRKTSVISPVPTRTVSPIPSAVAMIRLAWISPAPLVTGTTAIAAMTIESSASSRKMRQKRCIIE